MANNNRRFIKTLLLAGVLTLTAGISHSADKPGAIVEPPPPPYERSDALNTMINPHNQINDEGEVIWSTCLVCHANTPDIKKEKNIKDVRLRFEEDPNKVCRNCHLVIIHPGTEGVSASMSGFVAPDHLTVPPKEMQSAIRLTLKEITTILPLDPKTGKIICATCHNPHERGLLSGRADWGGDYGMRLRSAGLDICAYCHRK